MTRGICGIETTTANTVGPFQGRKFFIFFPGTSSPAIQFHTFGVNKALRLYSEARVPLHLLQRLWNKRCDLMCFFSTVSKRLIQAEIG